MALFGRNKKPVPELSREQAMSALPVLNQLVTVEYDGEGNAVLNLPRKRTSMVRLIAKAFRLPPYKKIELDELGTYAVELCDGENTVQDIVEQFARKFQLNRREAEVSMVTYLQTLARRGIIGFAVSEDSQP